ncbi:MAG: hypothetical protein KDB10_24100, partial [Acidimicrobiales bacterium]|nr:hypothetical protein [Acidimicrobiales bacterium]
MRPRTVLPALGAALALLAAACSSSTSEGEAASATTDAAVTTVDPAGASTTAGAEAGGSEPVAFTAEVWADNWFSLTVNGEAVGEDSVPITTERSFNAETIEFEATYPLTVAFVTKDFTEDASGLEYIGTPRQQLGDGGFIAQITDESTGEVVAVTDASWRGLAVQRAPLNTECVSSSDPTSECESEDLGEPDGWTDADYDDGAWDDATVYTAAQVDPKEGYDEIDWDPAAELIWTSDLEVDNTILWRVTVPAP